MPASMNTQKKYFIFVQCAGRRHFFRRSHENFSVASSLVQLCISLHVFRYDFFSRHHIFHSTTFIRTEKTAYCVLLRRRLAGFDAQGIQKGRMYARVFNTVHPVQSAFEWMLLLLVRVCSVDCKRHAHRAYDCDGMDGCRKEKN